MNSPKASLDTDDLVQVGWIGLCEAFQSYDETRGAEFWTYARQRVEGAMRDEVRDASQFPRSVGDEFWLESYDPARHGAEAPVPEPRPPWHEILAPLDERARQMVALHTIRGLALHRIGRLYDVTESRVQQIITAALKRLRGTLQ